MWKQTILIYLIAITTADGITSPNNNSLPCENMTECHCYDNGNFSVNVNCSDTCLTAKDVCGICSIIENVTGLDISANSIMELPPYCFKDCYKLMWLSLANNSLSTLQNDTFSGLSKLQYLNLDANRLIRYGNFSNRESLRPFKQLLTIHLQSNSNETAHGNVSGYLPNIPSDIIPNLFTIYVDGLPNATFGANFKNLKSLKHLYFSGKWANCKISALTNETFKSVAFLTHLDLSRCKIKYVDAGTFAMLTELRHLNMSFNLELGFPTLRNVSYGLQFTKLEVLDDSKVYKTFGLTTQLNRCDVRFLRNTSIKELYINSNRLALIEINVLALFPKAVETVHAEDNKFTYGEYALQIGCLKKLKALYLGKQDQTHSITGSNEERFLQENRLDTSGHCELSEYSVQLPCNISLNTTKLFDMTIPENSIPENLEILDFSSSALILDPVPYIESPISINSRIRFVNISENIMSTLQGSYFSLDTLEFLDLSNNYCSNISGGFFSNFPHVAQLYASGNKLGPHLAADQDGTIFEPLKKLLILDLSDNWIQILSQKIFTHLQSLKSMDLSSNRLDNITFEYTTNKKLSKFDVRQNRITTLPLGLLELMDAYSKRTAEQIEIDLSENILSVSCENVPFLTWMKRHQKYFAGIDSYLFQNEGQPAFTYEPRQANLCLRAFRHDKF